MVGTDILVENLERIALNLMLPIANFCGPISNQASVTLKIDAVSMYGKLLQAFEDLVLPYASPILKFIVEQLELHASIVSGTASIDPFEAMILRELYSEFISQSVDVCCSMVLISPHKLSEYAQSLFERCAHTMKITTDINCKYEIIELLAQLCLLALKSGEEQTPEEDFLDFEMRRIQAEDTELQQLRSESSSSDKANQATLAEAVAAYQKKLANPIWTFSGVSFDSFKSALTECVEVFEKEEYEREFEEEEDEEDEESGEDDEELSTASTAKKTSKKATTASSSAAESSSAPSFEPQQASAARASASASDDKAASGENKEGAGDENKRPQDESGAATVIALLGGVSFKYFSAEEHATAFQLVYAALLKKINTAFASPDSYSRLPPMLDALAQFLAHSASSLVAPHYAELTTLFDTMMKETRIWKSEDPSPSRRRAYGAIRGELLPAYSALLRQDPVSLLAQTEHFMTAVNFLLADPMILAEFGSALVSITDNETKLAEAKALLKDGLLFRIVDTYLRELSNPEASVSMKKVVMQSLGRLAMGTGQVFAPMLAITVPVLLFLGQQVPDLAPAAITASAQLVYAVRTDKDAVEPFLMKAVDQAIAMVLQDIVMSGLELSATAQKASPSEITFNFATKTRLNDEEDAEDEDEELEMMQDDNLADIVYKGECFLAFVMHIPEFIEVLEKAANVNVFERIFTTLVEIEEKPTLFEEDTMLKMTATDILLYMVENVKRTHDKAHREKAVNAMRKSDVESFEEELEEAITRLNRIKF